MVPIILVRTKQDVREDVDFLKENPQLTPISTAQLRLLKRQIACRGDINKWNAPLLAIYESRIPAEEEKAKQKHLLSLLEKVVWKEWPEARLFHYGSCANSFGFSKSDIDICLTIADADINKADVLLKLAELLRLENLQNVQECEKASNMQVTLDF